MARSLTPAAYRLSSWHRASIGGGRSAVGSRLDAAGSLGWGVLVDGFRPDRYDIAGAAVALVGVAIIVYAPR